MRDPSDQFSRGAQSRAATAMIALALIASGPVSLAQTDAAGLEFFENKIRPVFVEHCYKCHSAEATTVSG